MGGNAMRDLSLTSLQTFLDRKADEGLSFSVVDHLRWDVSAIFEMAIAEKVVEVSPATRLYTPKNAPKGQTRAMSVEQVNTVLAAVDLRERVLLHMVISSGFRPGEMLGLQRRHVAADGSAVSVEQRVYRGIIDEPKTDPSRREVAIPPKTAELLREWMAAAVGPEPEAYVFAGEKGQAGLAGHAAVRSHPAEAETPRPGVGGFPGDAGNPRQYRAPNQAQSEGHR
jgi:site-specific recombinase XerC